MLVDTDVVCRVCGRVMEKVYLPERLPKDRELRSAGVEMLAEHMLVEHPAEWFKDFVLEEQNRELSA